MEQCYQIANGPITIYVTPDCSGVNFHFKGFTLEQEPGVFYTNDRSLVLDDVDDMLKDRELVVIFDFLAGFYQAQATAEREKYVKQQLSKHKKIDDSEEFWGFWYRALIYAGRAIRMQNVGFGSLQNLVNGIAECTIGDFIGRYDFISQKHLGFYAGYGERSEKKYKIKALHLMYDSDCDLRFLAEEQDKRGIAPPAYTELVRINKFLEGKKNVRLVLQDHSEYKVKTPRYDSELSASHLLSANCLDGRIYFEVNQQCRVSRPGFWYDITLDDFKYLEYGKRRLFFDTDALKQLCKTKKVSIAERVSG